MEIRFLEIYSQKARNAGPSETQEVSHPFVDTNKRMDLGETKRIEFLFELYDKDMAGLFVKEKKKR